MSYLWLKHHAATAYRKNAIGANRKSHYDNSDRYVHLNQLALKIGEQIK